MRVVIATDSFAPQVNGVADTSVMIARMLSCRGYDVEVLAPGPGPLGRDGYRVQRLWSVPMPIYPQLRVAVPPKALLQSLRRQPPDAAIVLTPGSIGLSVARVVPARTRLVQIYTTDIPRYLGAYGLRMLRAPVERTLRWLSERASVTLCPTELVRRRLGARGYPRLGVWGRGVDTELFQPNRRSDSMRWRLSGGEIDKPLVLYVGRLAREKGLLDLYEAARLVPGARFALVGDGPQRDLLERRFAAVPSVFTGFLRGVPLASAFASADMFVFPSESETFGQVVLQAMASGLPAIVVQGTAPAEFVTDGVAGIHVPARSPSALAAAIRTLTADDDARRTMAAAARRAASRFSWSALLDQLEAVMLDRAGRAT